MYHTFLQRRRLAGFTLIELLVVIGIIGVLTSIVGVSYNEVRKHQRDQQRKTDLKQIQLALELHYEDNGSYPSPRCGANPYDGANPRWASPGPDGGAGWVTNCASYVDLEDYLPGRVLPVDPNQEEDEARGFSYASNGQDYKVMAYRTVERESVSPDDEFAVCAAFCNGSGRENNAPNNCNTAASRPDVYAVYSEGAACW